MTTRGQKSSERKLCERTFCACFLLSVYGLYQGADLMGLAVLVGALSPIPMAYCGARSYMKSKQGE